MKKLYEESKIAAIAKQIRTRTGTNDTYTTAEMPDGVDAVHAAGEASMLDQMWDLIQAKGKRSARCTSLFAYGAWDDDTFKPKYAIKPTYAEYMFAYIGYSVPSSKMLDLKGCFERAGVVLDTSGCTNMDMFAYNSPNITRFPAISFESCTLLNATFVSCSRLTSIDKIILRPDGKNTIIKDSYSRPFRGCTALTHMIVEGVIGCEYFDVSAAKSLDKESITSIISALSTTTSGLTVTLSEAAVNKAFETSAGANDGVSTVEWLELVERKPNWTISLV